MKKKTKEIEFQDQGEYDKIKLCQWCGTQLTKLGNDISLVRCPWCGNKSRSDEDKDPQCVDSTTMILRHSKMNEIKGVFDPETAKRLREQIDGVYDVKDLAGMLR